jgi:hypothetical protein
MFLSIARSRRAFFSKRSPWNSAPVSTVRAPLAQVPRQAGEKETGGSGVTKQAGRVQERAAERSLRKTGGVHGDGICPFLDITR